jgi:streptogramin lyase
VIEPGSAGLLWFTEQNAGKLASITTGGRIAEYAAPGPSGGEPSGIAPGSTQIWATEFNANEIVSLTP